MSLGKRISDIRDYYNCTQLEFSNKIGVSRQMISYYEKDQRSPSTAVILHICREFYISEEWLLNGTGEMLDQELIEREHKSKDTLLWMADKLEQSFHDLSMYMKGFDNEHHATILMAFDELVIALRKEMNDTELLFEYHDELTLAVAELSRFVTYLSDVVNKDKSTDKLSKYRAYRARFTELTVTIGNSFDRIFEVLYSDYESSMKSSIIEETKKASVIEEQPAIYKVRVLGDTAAGEPIEVYNRMDDLIDVPGSLTVDYALNIKGQSMEPNIADGSLVFVKQQDDLDQGDIGIFMIDDLKVTCKQYHRENGEVVLKSFNPEYKNMVFGPDSNIRILGKVMLNKKA